MYCIFSLHRTHVVLVFQLLREGFLLLGEMLLLELEFGLAFDGEFVVRDTRAELANGVGGVFGGEKAVKAGDVWLCVAELHS